MQAKTVLVTLFIGLATALPSPTYDDNDAVQGIEVNPSASDDDKDVSIMAQKGWEAAGGCKTDWDEDRRCINQCKGEANEKCPGWKTMTGVISSGCVVFFWEWTTCQCVCEY